MMPPEVILVSVVHAAARTVLVSMVHAATRDHVGQSMLCLEAVWSMVYVWSMLPLATTWKSMLCTASIMDKEASFVAEVITADL